MGEHFCLHLLKCCKYLSTNQIICLHNSSKLLKLFLLLFFGFSFALNLILFFSSKSSQIFNIFGAASARCKKKKIIRVPYHTNKQLANVTSDSSLPQLFKERVQIHRRLNFARSNAFVQSSTTAMAVDPWGK